MRAHTSPRHTTTQHNTKHTHTAQHHKHTHTHTLTHTHLNTYRERERRLWSYTVMYCLQSGFGLWGDVLLTVLCNTLSLPHMHLEVTGCIERSVNRQGRIWVTPIHRLKNNFYLSDNTRDHFTTFTELFSFDKGFHPSTSQKCVTGRKTLGLFVNHVSVILLRCPPLQVIATISP